MPELRRFLTRAGEARQRCRGAIDQLCAGRQQLSRHPHLQDSFMAAMREALAWHCLSDPRWAEACFECGCEPRSLRFYRDLTRLPRLDEQVHSPDREARDLRRWSRVADGVLCDLGWSRPRRRRPAGEVPLRLSTAPLAVWGRCAEGHWHLPRVVRVEGDRAFTPCFASRSLLWWPAEKSMKQGLCSCGRIGQWHVGQVTIC